MKKLILLVFAITIISCKDQPKKEVKQNKNIEKQEVFPEELGKVFNSH